MAAPPYVLLVEDDSALGNSIKRLLTGEGYELEWARNGKEALELVCSNSRFQAVVTDFRMPEMGGLQLLEKLRADHPHLPVILMTAHGGADLAIEATRKGAFDYLLKPFKLVELVEVVDRAIESSRLTEKPVEIGSTPESDDDSDAIIGTSRAMQDVYKEMGRIADKDVTVLIRGETGTGKELVARATWQHSNRSKEPFIAVNCAAIPDTLLESELFGHEKGSFTGADSKRIGRFEQADGGTLFLDEIGDMAPQTQVKLLRVLQERQITRVGGNKEIPVDVRVISATHRDLEKAIEDDQFREDLFFRLNAAQIRIPSLRERGGDMQLLAGFFLERYARQFSMKLPEVEVPAMESLESHDWPGNVRELENVIRKALLRCQGFPISKATISELLESGSSSSSGNDFQVATRVRELMKQAEKGEIDQVYTALNEEFEEAVYSEAISFTGGNQSKVARLLGISRVTLREKLDKYHLFPKRKAKN